MNERSPSLYFLPPRVVKIRHQIERNYSKRPSSKMFLDFVTALTAFLATAVALSSAFEFSQRMEFNEFDHVGFRGVPFFRFGLECSSSSSSSSSSSTPCGAVDVNLTFTGLRHGFAQVIVYRVDTVEWDAMAKTSGAHICSPQGQIYGAAVMRNFSSDAFVLDAQSGDELDVGVVVVRGRILLNKPGLYVVYPNACSFLSSPSDNSVLDRVWSDVDLRSSAGASSITGLGRSAMLLQNKNQSAMLGATMAGILVARSAKHGYLPAQVAPLLPGFAVFAAVDLVMLVAFCAGIAVVGGTRVVNKYQLTLCVIIALNLFSTALLLEFLWELETKNSVLEPLQIVAVVAGAVKETLSRTLAVFLFLGVGLTRVRFTPRVSGALAIAAVVYGVFRVALDRTRLWRELSLYPVFAPGHASVTFDSPWLTALHIHPFAVYADRAVCIAFECALGLFLASAARATLQDVPGSGLAAGKRQMLVRSVAAVAVFVIGSTIWVIIQLSVFGGISNSSSNNKLDVEVMWEFWAAIELVPGALDRAVLIALVVIWFPSKESLQWKAVSMREESISTVVPAGGTRAMTALPQAEPDDHHDVDVLEPADVHDTGQSPPAQQQPKAL